MGKKVNHILSEKLVIWGSWRRGDVMGLEILGYPNMTQEAKIRFSPGRSTVPHRSPGYWPDRTAKWVERRFQKHLESVYVNTLWCRFVECWDDDKCAKAMGVDKQQFRQLFDKAFKAAGDALDIRPWIWS